MSGVEGEKKKKKKKYQKDWESRYEWVSFDEKKDEMFCKFCREYPLLADVKSALFVGCGAGGNFREDTLFHHNKSGKHLKCEGKWKVEKNINTKETAPIQQAFHQAAKTLNDTTVKRMSALFNTAFYVAKENNAYSKFQSLCELQKKNGVDMGSMYQNYNGCKVIVSSIVDTEKSKIIEVLRNARFLSVLSEGSTDSSVTEQETVFVRYVGTNGHPDTQFVSIVALQSAHAEGVLTGIDEALNSVGLSRELLDSKLVGCNFDGAAVMLGSKTGVATRMRERLVGRDIVVLHCVAHNLELGVLDAIKQVKYLTIFQSTVQLVYKFYYYSPKRRRELSEIAKILEESTISQTGLQKTRWIASRRRALIAIEKSFPSVVDHLNHAASTGKGDDKARAKGIVQEICSERFVRFLYFMIDVTKILADLSRQFQNEELFITDVMVKLQTCLLRLEELKHRPGEYLNKLNSNLSQDLELQTGKDLTRQVKITIKSPFDFDKTFKTFLDNVIEYVNVRFSPIQSPPVSLFSVFDHVTWPHFPALGLFGTDQICDLVEFFKPMFNEAELEAMTEQWLELKVRLHRQREVSPFATYTSLLAARPESLKAILLLIEILFALSTSTAKYERSFSSMKRIKTGFRSSLNQESLVGLMRVANMETSVNHFDPVPAISNWLGNAKYRRVVTEQPTVRPGIKPQLPAAEQPDGPQGFEPLEEPALPQAPPCLLEAYESDNDHDTDSLSLDSD
ncbi:zinc finger protein 862-like [Mizuhopecten yessoensis]|uniref:zinc finger protein 862-like n=1 Tax=Mizuhopecten yessoensis TaxID=6573 RepID=UPI000B4586CC|nr:zinc finger protein 862-like [Mizuhopecten yessoensis]